MFKKLTLASSIAGISFVAQAAANEFSNTFNPAEFVDVTSEEAPLAIRIDSEALSPEVLEKLSSTSNIVFANLPNSPQFVSLKDYESIKYATSELLDELFHHGRRTPKHSEEEEEEEEEEEKKEEEKEEETDDFPDAETGDSPNAENGDSSDAETGDSSDADNDMEQIQTLSKKLGEMHKKHPMQDEESQLKEPKSEEMMTTNWETSTHELTATTWETSCSGSEDISCTPASTTSFTGTFEPTYSEKWPSSSSPKTAKKSQKTKKSLAPHSVSRSITSKHYEKTHNISYAYPTSTIEHSEHYRNHTNNTIVGFHNSSSAIVPTTMFLAFLLSILLFTQAC